MPFTPERAPTSLLRRRQLAMAAAGVLAGAGAGWLWLRGRAGDASLARVQASGELRVGYAVEAPYAVLLPDGRVSGESPEVARAVARHLGLRTAWVKTGFERLITELEARRFDLIAAGLFINPERAARLRFSRPTLRVRSGWLTLAGNPKGLAAYEQLTGRAGVRVAALAGSVEHAALEALHLPAGALVTVPDAQSGRAAVSSGAADALALSLPTVRQMASDSEGRLAALPAEGAGTRDHFVALAVHRDDAALQAAVNEALAAYIGQEEHRAMLRGFGLTAEDLPRAEDAR